MDANYQTLNDDLISDQPIEPVVVGVVTGDERNETECSLFLMERGDLPEPVNNAPFYKWRDGLCDCFNQIYPSCICAFFCTACYILCLYNKFRLVSPAKIMGNFFWIVVIIAIVLIFCGGSGAWLIFASLALIIRLNMRRVYNIKDDDGPLWDFFFTICCTPCAMSQIDRHITNYDGSCDTSASLCEMHQQNENLIHNGHESDSYIPPVDKTQV